ncbi:MAG: M14 family zinc carboxypeptidase, partial [Bacteroidota bacterium]
MQKIIWLCSFVCLSFISQAQLLSPDEFLPHKNGEQMTPHYMLVDYAQHVAENSEFVEWSQYGWTNEKRPLQLLTIASEENLARIEEIRLNNLRRAGVLEGDTNPDLDDISILWMSYGVHGNETAAPESAIPTIYYLANPQNADAQKWLENVVVLIDPSLNPDGYSRYSHWYRRVANKHNDPTTFALSHQEPWPGGRVNHYYFDLNRDWAWQSQVETQQRMPKYNEWLPHIHVDFHEQGVNSPYYFAPAARPFHEYITQWQKDFQVTIGKNHAKYFDQNGWLYFTKERFDLLYPSYGDTYPTYHGAIGMTYEQGGSGRAGRGIIMENGDTLTLKDRVEHHLMAGLSTVEVTANNAAKIVQNFKQFYIDSRTNPPGEYKTFIIKRDNAPERIKAFCKLLDKNQIQYGKAGQASRLTAYDYQTGEETKVVSVEEGDLIVSALQPKGLFTQVLLDPSTLVEDSLTYDITAWSLPYAYGLETYASKQTLRPGADFEFPSYRSGLPITNDAYAYLASWRSTDNARFLATLNKKGVRARYAVKAFKTVGKEYPAGTL